MDEKSGGGRSDRYRRNRQVRNTETDIRLVVIKGVG